MQALIVGPADTDLFADALSRLSAAVPPGQVQQVRRPEEILDAVPPDLVLVLQQWPDEYTQADVLTLIDAAPLARLLVCYGPWCESDGRTRDVWPLGTRVPVSHAASRLAEELDSLRQEIPPLPLTANRSEIYEHLLARPLLFAGDRISIAVVSASRMLSDVWSDVLTAAGQEVVDTPSTPADLLLWDADPWGRPARQELDSLRQTHPHVPIAAMVGFLRPHVVREIMDGGVATVISKSVDNHTLLQELLTAATKQPVMPGNLRLSPSL